MIESVVAHDGVTGLQSSQKKNVCGTCGKEFTRKRNLQRHEETQHPDQNIPETVAKRLKDTTSCNTRRRERRANDAVYREKYRQISQTNRMNKKARQIAEDGDDTGGVSTDIKTKSIPVDADTEAENKAESDVDTDADEPKRLSHGPCPGCIPGTWVWVGGVGVGA